MKKLGPTLRFLKPAGQTNALAGGLVFPLIILVASLTQATCLPDQSVLQSPIKGVQQNEADGATLDLPILSDDESQSPSSAAQITGENARPVIVSVTSAGQTIALWLAIAGLAAVRLGDSVHSRIEHAKSRPVSFSPNHAKN